MADNFYTFLENLTDEQWDTKVDKNWTVRDVIAHLVGWEKECAIQTPIVYRTKQKPWFLKTNDYEKFNRKSIEEYKNFTLTELLQEWRKWQDKIQTEIDLIGEDKLKSQPKLFYWLFEDDSNKGTDAFEEYGESHYSEHFKQIKAVLEKQTTFRSESTQYNPRG